MKPKKEVKIDDEPMGETNGVLFKSQIFGTTVIVRGGTSLDDMISNFNKLLKASGYEIQVGMK